MDAVGASGSIVGVVGGLDGVGLGGFPEMLQLFLELLLLLYFFVPVYLAAQFVGENDLSLHLKAADFLLHFLVFAL